MNDVALLWTLLCCLAAWVALVVLFQPVLDQRLDRTDRARRFLRDYALWVGRNNLDEPPPVYD
jgi:hypothetical protein